MQKNKTNFIAAIYIAGIFLIYSIIVFILAGFNGHTASFWVSYVFIIITFGLIFIVNIILFADKKPFRYWFLGLPILKWSVVYTGAAIITSTIFMFIDNFAIAAVIHILLIAIYCSITTVCYFQKAHILAVDQRKIKISYIRLLRAELDTMSKTQTNPQIKREIEKIAEAVRFSDPNSHNNLTEIEQKIKTIVETLKNNIVENNIDDIFRSINSLNESIIERNEMCKAYKNM